MSTSGSVDGEGGIGPIPPSDRIGRLGVMYVRAVLAQAALGNTEIQSGEDHLSLDITVNFRAAPISLQIKAGHKRLNRDDSFSVATTEKWRTDWAASRLPIYLVYVHLEKEPPVEWLDHSSECTTVHAHAHWCRVDGLSATSVKVPVANRLTIDTFTEWALHIEQSFGRPDTV